MSHFVRRGCCNRCNKAMDAVQEPSMHVVRHLGGDLGLWECGKAGHLWEGPLMAAWGTRISVPKTTPTEEDYKLYAHCMRHYQSDRKSTCPECVKTLSPREDPAPTPVPALL